MLTIFTIPKPFTNELVKTIQTNAIRSWLALSPQPEIILFGNEIGVKEIAEKYHLKHIPDLLCNDKGTPFLDYIFRYAEENAENDMLCYVNCDIIFLQDVIESVKSVTLNRFLMVGQRWDLDVTELLNIDDITWRDHLIQSVNEKGVLKPSVGSDYFIYKKSTPVNMPKFLIGRAGWDNWMIYQFMNRSIPVIDGTQSIKDIHQNHDYSHIRGGNTKSYSGKESGYNMNIIKKQCCNLFAPKDSDWILCKNRLYRRKNSFKSKIYHLYCLNPFVKNLMNFIAYWLMGYMPKRLDRSLIDYVFDSINDKIMIDLFMQAYSANEMVYELTKKLPFFSRRKTARFLLRNKIV